MDAFSFRRLRVYRLSLALARYAYEATRGAPSDARTVVWQLTRASSSVSLNIAEGCGEYSPKDKARFFRMARRSSWEAVAAMDVLVELGAIDPKTRQRTEAGYAEVGAMLTTLAKRFEGIGRGPVEFVRQRGQERSEPLPRPEETSAARNDDAARNDAG